MHQSEGEMPIAMYITEILDSDNISGDGSMEEYIHFGTLIPTPIVNSTQSSDIHHESDF